MSLEPNVHKVEVREEGSSKLVTVKRFMDDMVTSNCILWAAVMDKGYCYSLHLSFFLAEWHIFARVFVIPQLYRMMASNYLDESMDPSILD